MDNMPIDNEYYENVIAYNMLVNEPYLASIVDHLDGHADHTKLMRQLLTHDSWIRNFNIDTTTGAV